MAIITSLLQERLDGLGKNLRIGIILSRFCGILLLLFRHFSSITSALRIVCFDFIPNTRAKPEHRNHQQANITDQFEPLRAYAKKQAVGGGAQVRHLAINHRREKTSGVPAIFGLIKNRIFRSHIT